MELLSLEGAQPIQGAHTKWGKFWTSGRSQSQAQNKHSVPADSMGKWVWGAYLLQPVDEKYPTNNEWVLEMEDECTT